MYTCGAVCSQEVPSGFLVEGLPSVGKRVGWIAQSLIFLAGRSCALAITSANSEPGIMRTKGIRAEEGLGNSRGNEENKPSGLSMTRQSMEQVSR